MSRLFSSFKRAHDIYLVKTVDVALRVGFVTMPLGMFSGASIMGCYAGKDELDPSPMLVGCVLGATPLLLPIAPHLLMAGLGVYGTGRMCRFLKRKP